MENFKVSKDSWHFKVAGWGHADRSLFWYPKDFCSYWRTVVLKLLFAFILTTFVSYVFASPFGLLYDWWMGNELSDDSWWSGGVAVLVIGFTLAIGAGAAVVIRNLAEKSSRRRSSPKPPSLLKTKYRSWKEKYCPLVEYDTE